MILAMTATPLAMVHHHHDLAAAATVIQLHVLGMFLPSFFTGSLIARFGVLRDHAGRRRCCSPAMSLMTLTGTGVRIVRGRAGAARCRLELPLHRRHDAADDHLYARGDAAAPRRPTT